MKSSDTKSEGKNVPGGAVGVEGVRSEVLGGGGAGGEAVGAAVVRLCEEENRFRFAYGLDGTIGERLDALCRSVYRADGVILTPEAKKQAARLTALGFGNLPVCVAKTQYSFSDNAALRGAPEGFTVTVRELHVSAGAGFLVALTGDIMTMPGLPKSPAAERIDVDETGVITGMF